jgi:hypothetical protein
MQTNTTKQQIETITDALRTIYIYPFNDNGTTPKANAQRNLDGKTHFVDEDTLKLHKSRVVDSNPIHGGLLLRVTHSDALDTNNTQRGYRTTVFDLFGSEIFHESLEKAHNTKKQAVAASEALQIDLVAHYKQALITVSKRGEDAKKAAKSL